MEEVMDLCMNIMLREEDVVIVIDKADSVQTQLARLEFGGSLPIGMSHQQSSHKSHVSGALEASQRHQIQDLSPDLFPFTFFHELDRGRVGGPWTFDRQLLITQVMEEGMTPKTAPLLNTQTWVQVSDLPYGFRSEIILHDIGSLFGV